MIARGGVGNGIMQMGLSSYSMGLDWTRIHTHVSKATTSSKGFISKRLVNPYTIIYLAMYIMLCIIFLCRVKNKPHEGAMHALLFLGLLTRLLTVKEIMAIL
jgi:hypothetical protein